LPDAVVFIVNQKSKRGIEIAHRLESHLPQTGTVKHIQTRTPDEAVFEVEEAVQRYAKPLIISVSGDGGTNLVYGTAFRAKMATGNEPIVASVAAGGGNDHAECVLPVKLKSLPKVIEAGNTRPLDLIRVLFIFPDGTRLEIILVSYGGFSITADVGERVNQQASRTFFSEAVASLRGAMNLQHFRIEIEGQPQKLANLTFHNIPRMARILKIAPEAQFDDGVIEMLKVPSTRLEKAAVLGRAVRAAFGSSRPEQLTEPFHFKLLDTAPFQFDGDTRLDDELVVIPAGTQVVVSCIPGAIETLVP
jgi:diacylglycerol kinase family enzyme